VKETRSSKTKHEPAPNRLDWTEMLNEEAAWCDYSDFAKWFASIAPELKVPDEPAYSRFRTALEAVRTEAARIYFGEPVNTELVNGWLRDVTLELDNESVAGTRLPLLLAARTERHQTILDRLMGALLVGFAQFVAEHASGGPGLCRCQGVFRDQRFEGATLKDFELRYRREIELLDEQDLLEDPSVQRCADFFVGRSKARFCSDSCRFVTFQISKQMNDPGYLAEKQRRYRERHRT